MSGFCLFKICASLYLYAKKYQAADKQQGIEKDCYTLYSVINTTFHDVAIGFTLGVPVRKRSAGL